MGGPMRREIHRGRVVQLGLEDAELPGGRRVELEIVRHAGAAAVVAIDDEGCVVLIRQFRWAAGGELWEIPAGVRDRPDEPFEACAKRELAEEVGLEATTLTRLGRIFPTPGYSAEAIELFLGTGLSACPSAREADEAISEVRRVPLAEALDMVDAGEIVDGKTIAGLHLAARRLGSAG
jgi:8-oxo-dGTP pyrophosphatase MutT (NUDIX family)